MPNWRLRGDVISPDGVPIKVNLRGFTTNKSVFIPCINTSRALAQFKRMVAGKKWQVRSYVRIEKGMYGVRILRIK